MDRQPFAEGDETAIHVAAPVLGTLIMAVNEEARELMFGERLGIQMMIGAAVLQGIGTLIIRKIVNIPY